MNETQELMSGLLITALEGGSNYWIESIKTIPPKGMSYKGLRRAAWDAAPKEEKEFWKDEGPDGGWPLYSMIAYLPQSVAWKVHFKGSEGGEGGYLTPKSMRGALAKIAKEYPKVVQRIKTGQYDANDADVWLQMAVLGDVIFG